MKTTVELPDMVFRRAKAEAAMEGRALRAFILDAVVHVLPAQGRRQLELDPFCGCVGRVGQWDVRTGTPVKQVLRQVGLLVDNHVTVAAILLFGRNAQQFLPQAVLRCGRFKGTGAVHFLDMDVVQGNVIEQVERAMAFVKRSIRIGVEIRGLQREDVWEYPLMVPSA
jgi:hypothetical protein